MAIIAFHFATGNSSIGATCWMPALLTRMSSVAEAFFLSGTHHLGDVIFLRHVWRRNRARRTLAWVRAMFFAQRLARWPRIAQAVDDDVGTARRKALAISRPMPLVEPVTIAVFPESMCKNSVGNARAAGIRRADQDIASVNAQLLDSNMRIFLQPYDNPLAYTSFATWIVTGTRIERRCHTTVIAALEFDAGCSGIEWGSSWTRAHRFPISPPPKQKGWRPVSAATASRSYFRSGGALGAYQAGALSGAA